MRLEQTQHVDPHRRQNCCSACSTNVSSLVFPTLPAEGMSSALLAETHTGHFLVRSKLYPYGFLLFAPTQQTSKHLVLSSEEMTQNNTGLVFLASEECDVAHSGAPWSGAIRATQWTACHSDKPRS